DAAGAGRGEMADEPHERPLPAAARPDQRNELALSDRQADIVQRCNSATAAVVGFGHMVDGDDWCVHSDRVLGTGDWDRQISQSLIANPQLLYSAFLSRTISRSASATSP